MKWKHFPRYWPFLRGIHRSPVNSRIKASDAELWCFLWSAHWINGWVNNRGTGDLRQDRVRYNVIVMDTRFHIDVTLIWELSSETLPMWKCIIDKNAFGVKTKCLVLFYISQLYTRIIDLKQGSSLHTYSDFYPSAQIGLEGYCRHPAGGRAGVTTAPLPLSRAQLLSHRGQTW